MDIVNTVDRTLSHITNTIICVLGDIEKSKNLEKNIYKYIKKFCTPFIAEDSTEILKQSDRLINNSEWLNKTNIILEKGVSSILADNIKYQLKTMAFEAGDSEIKNKKFGKNIQKIYNENNPDEVVRKFKLFLNQTLNNKETNEKYKGVMVLVSTYSILGYVGILDLFIKNAVVYSELLKDVRLYVIVNELVPKEVLIKIKNLQFFGGKDSEYIYLNLIEVIENYNRKTKENNNSKKKQLVSKKDEITYSDSTPTESRMDRIKRYNERKNNLDNEELLVSYNLSIEQQNIVDNYVNMIIKQESTINDLIEMIPYDYFDNAKVALYVIIGRLSQNNTNHFTNKMLVILNTMLKENIAKSMKRKNKKTAN